MAVRIRLRRMGTRGKPFYRMVVADGRSPRDGRFIDLLGYYDPRTDPPTLKIDEEKALLWLSRGAQPSDTAGALLKKDGVVEKFLSSKKGEVAQTSVEVEVVPTTEVKAVPRKRVKAVSTETKPEAAKPVKTTRRKKTVEPEAEAQPEAAAEQEAVAEPQSAAEPETATEPETTGEEQEA